MGRSGGRQTNPPSPMGAESLPPGTDHKRPDATWLIGHYFGRALDIRLIEGFADRANAASICRMEQNDIGRHARTAATTIPSPGDSRVEYVVTSEPRTTPHMAVIGCYSPKADIGVMTTQLQVMALLDIASVVADAGVSLKASCQSERHCARRQKGSPPELRIRKLFARFLNDVVENAAALLRASRFTAAVARREDEHCSTRLFSESLVCETSAEAIQLTPQTSKTVRRKNAHPYSGLCLQANYILSDREP